MKVKSLLAFLVIGFQASSLQGASTGGYPAAFLQVPVYPRPIAMGGAFSALATGPSAIFWNPAGLAELEHRAIAVSYSKMTLDRTHSFAAVTLPFGNYYNAVSIGFVNVGVQNIDKRDATGTKIGTFNDSESALFIAFALSFVSPENRNISVDIGVDTKLITHTFDDADAKGFSFDVGMVSDFYHTFKFALVLHDLLGQLKWNTGTTEEIPLRLKTGFAVAMRSIPLILEADMSYHLKAHAWTLFTGAELTLLRILSIRGGYNTRTSTPSFGLGIKVSHRLAFDYAYTLDQLDPGASHHAGLTLSF